MLSIIVPAYNEEQMVPLAEQAISQLMQQENIPYELLFINDARRTAHGRGYAMQPKRTKMLSE